MVGGTVRRGVWGKATTGGGRWDKENDDALAAAGAGRAEALPLLLPLLVVE